MPWKATPSRVQHFQIGPGEKTFYDLAQRLKQSFLLQHNEVIGFKAKTGDGLLLVESRSLVGEIQKRLQFVIHGVHNFSLFGLILLVLRRVMFW